VLPFLEGKASVSEASPASKSLFSVSPAWVPWLLSLLFMPFAQAAGLPLAALLTWIILVQAALVTTLLLPAWGTRRTLGTFLAISLIAYVSEVIGVSTGLPFGRYSYTPVLPAHLLGVPLLIPLAWWMTLPAAWGVASAMGAAAVSWRFVLVSALAMTAWDLFLDPQMVAWGVWHWQDNGAYLGIPLSNFIGWSLVAAFMTTITRPIGLPYPPFRLLYTALWAMNTFAFLVFWHWPAAALAGFLGMGYFVWRSWR